MAADIIYRTEGLLHLKPRTTAVSLVAVQWEKNSGTLKLLSSKATIELDQMQLKELVRVSDVVLDDIGPEHPPRPT